MWLHFTPNTARLWVWPGWNLLGTISGRFTWRLSCFQGLPADCQLTPPPNTLHPPPPLTRGTDSRWRWALRNPVVVPLKAGWFPLHLWPKKKKKTPIEGKRSEWEKQNDTKGNSSLLWLWRVIGGFPGLGWGQSSGSSIFGKEPLGHTWQFDWCFMVLTHWFFTSTDGAKLTWFTLCIGIIVKCPRRKTLDWYLTRVHRHVRLCFNAQVLERNIPARLLHSRDVSIQEFSPTWTPADNLSSVFWKEHSSFFRQIRLELLQRCSRQLAAASSWLQPYFLLETCCSFLKITEEKVEFLCVCVAVQNKSTLELLAFYKFADVFSHRWLPV